MNFNHILLQLNWSYVYFTYCVAVLCIFIVLSLKFAMLFMKFDNFDLINFFTPSIHIYTIRSFLLRTSDFVHSIVLSIVFFAFVFTSQSDYLRGKFY